MQKLIKYRIYCQNFVWLILNYVDLRKSIGNLDILKFEEWSTEVFFFTTKFDHKKTFIKVHKDIGKFDREFLVQDYLKNAGLKVPELLSTGKGKKFQYLLFEYIDGRTLNNVQFDLVSFISLLDQILDTLQVLSKGGLIHCDIRPENLLFTKDGDLVLIDFEYLVVRGEAGLDNLGYEDIERLKGLGGRYKRGEFYWDDAYSFWLIVNEIKNSLGLKNGQSDIVDKLLLEIKNLIGRDFYELC